MKTLKFYADERNYLHEYSYDSDEYMDSVVDHDAGDRDTFARLGIEDGSF
ncbi:hypothetical protein [Lysinibacillus sphaericus]|nr:hypothetical protein [Lysinibacillus sphaericus]